MDTISAIATAAGRGGVAIVRVSGEGALKIAEGMFSHKGGYEPNRMYFGKIDCGELEDLGLCVYFRSPHSFTGEDTVEFHCHGGTEIARAVLSRTFFLGARPAEAGEFTRRAFLNGKLSLSAAEGLGEMILANSRSEARAGCSLFHETLTREVQRLQAILRTCLAEADADVDYPEEDLSISLQTSVARCTKEVRQGLEQLLQKFSASRKIRSGVRVAICGRPNAGKSSLLNALLGYDRAIVSDREGTTRDLIEETIEIDGVLFCLTDTAGLHACEDALEEEGVRRAKGAIRSADVILYLKEEGDEIFLPKEVPVIVVGAKCDVKVQDGCEIYVSSKTGEGIEALKKMLFLRGFGMEHDGDFLLEERHREALSEALEYTLRAQKCADGCGFSELIAEELRAAYLALGKITGENSTEELLKEIFGRFCVGK